MRVVVRRYVKVVRGIRPSIPVKKLGIMGLGMDLVSGEESEMEGIGAVEAVVTVLFVDDEPNILSALKRLFRPLGYRILTAGGGEEGLRLLEREFVDLVVSDMRMPAMSGAQFLEQVTLRYPDTVRILLTGHAELDAITEAINKGQIYRYVAKPWEDNDIITAVRLAIERQQLKKQKEQLETLTRRQNEELRLLNSQLEEKVKSRTAQLDEAYEKLKKNFITSIHVFSNLLEMREKSFVGHSRRVAEMARNIAQRMKLPAEYIQDIFVAGLLHDIGKIGLTDQILRKPWSLLTPDERSRFEKHASTGEASLMALEQLHEAAKLIRSHHERFDGSGYPDGLKREDIPLGARILSVANDFDSLRSGSPTSDALPLKEALSYLVAQKGMRYDPAVVDAAVDFLTQTPTTKIMQHVMKLRSDSLEPGMILAKDLCNEKSMLLLPKDSVLNERLISKIREYEAANNLMLALFIQVIPEEHSA